MVLVGFVLLAIFFCIGSVYGNNFHQFQVNLKCEMSPPVIVYYHSTIIYMHTCYECSRYRMIETTTKTELVSATNNYTPGRTIVLISMHSWSHNRENVSFPEYAKAYVRSLSLVSICKTHPTVCKALPVVPTNRTMVSQHTQRLFSPLQNFNPHT